MTLDSDKILRLLLIILFVGFAIALTIQSWVLPIAFVVIITFLILTVRKPAVAVLLIFFAKPIIDATWEFKVPLVGLNFLQITGVAFPVIAFLIIYSHKVQFANHKAVKLFGLFVAVNFVSYFVSTVGAGNSIPEGMYLFVRGSGVLFQFLNSYAAYLIIPFLFRTDQDRKRLFWALLLAGIFPTITGILQISGIVTGRTLRTTGELIRISGFYHDSTNMRMYALQTILAIYIYISTYLNVKDRFFVLQKVISLALLPLSLLVVYRGYSKAALGIIVSWIVIYFLFQRKVFLGSVIILLLGTAYLFSDTISKETEKLFYKEIKYAEGTLPEEVQYTLLGGRFVSWGNAIEDFTKQDLASQLIGYNYMSSASSHNDFLRVLLANGFIGLSIYMIMLLVFALSLLNSYIRYNDALSLGAIMVFASFIIDSIGLVPLLYPGYCWIVFGIISLSLNRDVHAANYKSVTHDPM